MTVVLRWLVDDAVAEKVIQTDCLIEEEVECRPERVQNSILDENVDVCLIRKYFTNEVSLDCVYHYKCVGLVTKPKMKNW